MKIGIDVSSAIYGTGVSVYTKQLVSSLLKIDKENNYVLFAGTLRRKKDILNIFSQCKVYSIPPKLADFVWNRLHVLPIEKLIGEVDVFHSSDWAQPPTKAGKVTTVHDLIPVRFPKIIHPKIVSVHKKRLEWVKKEVDRVIVPSVSTKLDLIDYGYKEEKIIVIPEANIVTKADIDNVKKVLKKYQITGEYILGFASSLYKNTENSMDAFELASAGKNLKMLVIGRQSNTKIKERRNVRLMGFVNDLEYSALLTGAKALVFPSLYEGFGVPILDAFACETPVVTSNISSMPEIAGDGAVLVDPINIHSIAQGIEESLAKPKTLIAKGLKQLSKFSWQKTAEETLKVYREVIEQERI